MEPSGMHRMLVALLVAAVTAAGLAACGEKPPRTIPKGEAASYNNSDNGESRLRERTMNQGSSERINN
jgi:predicted small lipoprotein YifL